jgi:hypothetical protein
MKAYLKVLFLALLVAFAGTTAAEESGSREFQRQLALATAGNTSAMVNVGYNYSHGYNGVSQNYERAFYWYRLAAENGDSNGQHNLGLMYCKGEYVARDLGEARRWFNAARIDGDFSLSTQETIDRYCPDSGDEPPEYAEQVPESPVDSGSAIPDSSQSETLTEPDSTSSGSGSGGESLGSAQGSVDSGVIDSRPATEQNGTGSSVLGVLFIGLIVAAAFWLIDLWSSSKNCPSCGKSDSAEVVDKVFMGSDIRGGSYRDGGWGVRTRRYAWVKYTCTACGYRWNRDERA